MDNIFQAGFEKSVAENRGNGCAEFMILCFFVQAAGWLKIRG